jgi:hypothetical protein
MNALKRGVRIGHNSYRADELLLLVVDNGTDEYFRAANVAVSSKNKLIPIEFKSSQLVETRREPSRKSTNSSTMSGGGVGGNKDDASDLDEISININLNDDVNNVNSSFNSSSCDEIELITFV